MWFLKWWNLLFPPKILPTPEDGGDVVEDVVEIPVEVPLEVEPPAKDEPIVSHYHYILDCGHGGLTAGKRSPILPEGGRLLEWQYTGRIGKQLSKRLTKLRVDHSLIPPSQENVGNHLQYSVDFANNLKVDKPKIFISLHGNAGPVCNSETDWSTDFSGVEVWHFTPSPKSKLLAQLFQRALVARSRWNNRGIKSKNKGQFYVLRNTNMPAILTECGFYNNIRECRLMLQKETTDMFAEAHVDAIKELENTKII